MSEPQSSVARFGVSLVGPTFQFSWLEQADDGDYDVRTDTFRAHPGLPFDEQLIYTRHQAMLQAMASTQSKAVLALVDDMPKGTAEEMVTAMESIADVQIAQANERWEIIKTMTLMLVAPRDRERLAPLLDASNSEDIRELRDHLQKLVIDRDKKLVEVAGGVDPTSLPSSTG